jgi:hypothetical protein
MRMQALGETAIAAAILIVEDQDMNARAIPES